MARPRKNQVTDDLGDFDDEVDSAEKETFAAPVDEAPKQNNPAPILQEKHTPGIYQRVGYVNGKSVLFPVGFKFKGGFVGTRGNVILNRCPKCNSSQGIDDALSGKCAVCKFNKYLELEEFKG